MIHHEDIYGYYRILGLTYPASYEDIKKNYRILAKKSHPDLNKSGNAKEIFQKIYEAYSVLGNSVEKDKYDSMCIKSDNFRFNKENNRNRENNKNEQEDIREEINEFKKMMEKDIKAETISYIKMIFICIAVVLSILFIILCTVP